MRWWEHHCARTVSTTRGWWCSTHSHRSSGARTVTEIRRRLAALSGLSVRQVNAEYQRRGAIHLHAVFRLDARTTEPEPQPPPPPFDDPHLLLGAIHAAARRVSINVPGAEDRADELRAVVRWGNQLDVTVITTNQPADTAAGSAAEQDATAARAVANYLAKYVTKALPGLGTSAQHGDSDPHRRHVRRIRATCRRLGRDPALDELSTAERVEGFGYPSRPLSRSRHYSTTMGALRAERQRHATTPAETTERRADPDSASLQIGIWRYIGQGWRGLGEASWAQTQAEQRLEAAGYARQARATERQQTGPPG